MPQSRSKILSLFILKFSLLQFYIRPRWGMVSLTLAVRTYIIFRYAVCSVLGIFSASIACSAVHFKFSIRFFISITLVSLASCSKASSMILHICAVSAPLRSVLASSRRQHPVISFLLLLFAIFRCRKAFLDDVKLHDKVFFFDFFSFLV